MEVSSSGSRAGRSSATGARRGEQCATPPEFGSGDPHPAGELGLGRSTTQLAQQRLFGDIDATGHGPESPWRPVPGPGRIEDGTTDSHDRIPLEGNAAVGIPTPGRFDEAESSGASQLAAIDMLRERTADLGHHPVDQGECILEMLDADTDNTGHVSGGITRCVALRGR